MDAALSFQYWHEGLIFISIFLVAIGLPCLAVGVLGTRLINHLGRYPSQSANIQMSVCIKLLFIEIFSFAILALVFHIFSD